MQLAWGNKSKHMIWLIKISNWCDESKQSDISLINRANSLYDHITLTPRSLSFLSSSGPNLLSYIRTAFLGIIGTRGGTVQLFHGSVCITVLETRIRYVLGKTILSNKNNIIYLIWRDAPIPLFPVLARYRYFYFWYLPMPSTDIFIVFVHFLILGTETKRVSIMLVG